MRVYPSGQVHVAPDIGAGKSIHDCPGRQGFGTHPSASFSQKLPSYPT